MKKIILLLFLLLLITVGGGSFYIYKIAHTQSIITPSNNVKITIEKPLPFKAIPNFLYQQKIIDNPQELALLLKVKNLENKTLPAGKYLLKKEWNNNQLANQFNLMRNQRRIVQLTFGSVRTLEDLAKKISQTINADSTELMRTFNDVNLQKKYGFNNQTFISLFIPNTYEVYSDITPEELVARMAKEYKKFWTAERKEKAKKLGLSQSEVTTLASIVHEEQKVKIDEQPKIAGLYLNRLKNGWLLQADPTVKYALNNPSLKRLLYKHLEIDSPYNTYKYTGLPPGPICIPEPNAIDAVLNHEKHNYFFMCAKPEYSGYHNFAQTNAQHEANARIYHNWLKKQGIR